MLNGGGHHPAALPGLIPVCKETSPHRQIVGLRAAGGKEQPPGGRSNHLRHLVPGLRQQRQGVSAQHVGGRGVAVVHGHGFKGRPGHILIHLGGSAVIQIDHLILTSFSARIERLFSLRRPDESTSSCLPGLCGMILNTYTFYRLVKGVLNKF